MNKVLTFLLFIGYLSTSLAQGVNEVSAEDVEIQKIEKEIAVLNKKLLALKKEKYIKHTNADRKVALVLSGGGAKGFSHIGVLKVLEENNIKIDYIVGSSIGAVIGALYSAGYTPDEIEEQIKSLSSDLFDNMGNSNPNRTDIPLEQRLESNKYAFSIKYDSDFNITFPKSLKNSQRNYIKLKSLLANVENIQDFDKLPIPIRVIATNLDTGKTESFKEGDLAKTLLASTAIPSVFDPVKIGDYHYIDSLVTRNFPVENAVELGATTIIGVNVGTEMENSSKNYNILNTAEQILAIQSASSTKFQKKFANILIEPPLEKYSSLDYKKYNEIIEIGTKAAKEKSDLFSGLPKKESKSNENLKTDDNTFNINKVFISGIDDVKKFEIVENILTPYMDKDVLSEDLNRSAMKLYGLDFINKVYYKTYDNNLYVSVEENPSNTLGVGLNYQSDYYTSLKIATDLKEFGKFDSLSNVYIKAGDYLGVGGKNTFYYGLNNKFGVNIGLNYDESPLFLYNRKIKEAILKKETVNFDLSVLTNYRSEILLSYGFSMRTGSIKQKVGHIENIKDFNSKSDNYGQGFFKALVDKADSVYYPKKGYIGDFNYFWGGSYEKNSSDFFGSSLSMSGFMPLNKNLSLHSNLTLSNVDGTNIPFDEYIKLGGKINNSGKREFSFLGYSPQQKLLEELSAFKLSLQYEFLPNTYLIGEYNLSTFKEYNYFSNTPNYTPPKIWKDYFQGYGLTIGYLSPIGPIEFSVSRNNDLNDFIYLFSIGYTIE